MMVSHREIFNFRLRYFGRILALFRSYGEICIIGISEVSFFRVIFSSWVIARCCIWDDVLGVVMLVISFPVSVSVFD